MAVGLSFMAGPILGTVLVKTYQEAILLSMALTACSGIFIALLPTPAAQAAQKAKPSSGLMDFVRMPVLRTRGAQLLMAMRLLMALAFHMFMPVWQVRTTRRERAPRFSRARASFERGARAARVCFTRAPKTARARARARAQVSLKTRFSFGPKDHAMFMGLIGLSYALSQGSPRRG